MKDGKGIHTNGGKKIKVTRISADVLALCLNGVLLNKRRDFTSFKQADVCDKPHIVSRALTDARKGVGRAIRATMRSCCIWMHSPGIHLDRGTRFECLDIQ
jgi:hypothetical protein